MSAAQHIASSPKEAQDDTLVSRIVPLGSRIVDMAGFLDGIEEAARGNLSQVGPLRDASTTISGSIDQLSDDFHTLRDETTKAEQAADEGLVIISKNAKRFTELAEWGSGIEARTDILENVLEKIVAGNSDIAKIARKVNMLAINASIEAARAGEAGRGFAVVAEAVGDLSRQTTQAALEIGQTIESLDQWTKALRADAMRLTPEFIEGRESAAKNRASIQGIAEAMTAARQRLDEMTLRADGMRDAGLAIQPIVESVDFSAQTTAKGVKEARERSEGLTDAVEALMFDATTREGAGGEARFIQHVQTYAARVSAVLTEALDRKQISEADLFSLDYKKIPGTDPVQHLTPCTKLCEQLLPALTEEAGQFDPATIFCCAADRGGYIAVHNKKFSKPQGDDPAWNAAHSRNRRIFNDRVGLKAGQNTKPFLLQMYRRDMGAEGMVIMKDVSAPVTVRGRHWGCVRMGYR